MTKPTLDLIQLAGLGVNLIIDAKTRFTLDIIQIVGCVVLKQGAHNYNKCTIQTDP